MEHPTLIPAPTTWRPADGNFALADLRRIVVREGGGELRALADRISARLEPVLSSTLPIQKENSPSGSLLIGQADALAPEQYEMRVTGDGIELAATDQAGFFHGVTTLIQLAINGQGVLPCGLIQDQPRFGWRGMLLDCGRHFMSVEFIKDLLDKLALHKFNVLHWHLTEDQGWRLEIPGYPQLTEIGAWRTEIDGSIHGGYYTADDVRQVVAHAAERFITVVPEIEMPGHSLAALAAYPELSCTGGPFSVPAHWGVFEDVLCLGREETFDFLEAVLTRVMDLFPGRYIHIGGDETPPTRWLECERCRARIEDESLPGASALQGWFTTRIGKFLAEHGRRLVAWDEILASIAQSGKIDPGLVTVQAWRGMNEVTRAVRSGHDVVVSPTSHVYFDYDPGVLDLQQVYDFRPVPADLAGASGDRILGAQMNLWTEYIPQTRVDAMLFPRLTAMAEALWTGAPKRDFAAFLNRLEGHRPVLNHLGVKPGAAARPVTLTGHHDPHLSAFFLKVRLDSRIIVSLAGRVLVVRYRLLESPLPPSFRPDALPENQGLPPVTSNDEVAPEMLEIPTADREGKSWLVQARLFVDGRPYGAPAVLEIRNHAAVGANIGFFHENRERDPGLTAEGLVNGLHGSRFFQDGLWTGCEGEDLEAIVDLGLPRMLAGVSVRFLQDANARIFLPREVRFSVSCDGELWRHAEVVSHQVPDRVQEKLIHEFAVNPEESAVRYVRVRGISPRVCPEWHPAPGEPCRLFADEIVCLSSPQTEPRSQHA